MIILSQRVNLLDIEAFANLKNKVTEYIERLEESHKIFFAGIKSVTSYIEPNGSNLECSLALRLKDSQLDQSSNDLVNIENDESKGGNLLKNNCGADKRNTIGKLSTTSCIGGENTIPRRYDAFGTIIATLHDRISQIRPNCADVDYNNISENIKSIEAKLGFLIPADRNQPINEPAESTLKVILQAPRRQMSKTQK